MCENLPVCQTRLKFMVRDACYDWDIVTKIKRSKFPEYDFYRVGLYEMGKGAQYFLTKQNSAIKIFVEV